MKFFGRYIRGNELYPLDYIDFYEANFLESLDFDGVIVYDGLTVSEFKQKYSNGYLYKEEMVDILKDKRLSILQEELIAEGKQVCIFNLYILCMYLTLKVKSRYVWLLEPTIEDLLEKEISSITFNYKDGTSMESSKMVKEIKDILSKNKSDIYKIKKMVTWDKVSNKALVNSYFVHDLAVFLHKYFPVKRKKDALVSTKEVELILYMMKLFELVPEEPTNKRFWHLMAYYKKVYVPIARNFSISTFKLPDTGEDVHIPLCLIPYKVWSAGKIDWENIQPLQIETGDIIQL